MGMYTDFCFDSELKESTPPEVIALLQNWRKSIWVEELLPNHELFQCTRWSSLGIDGSYYFAGPGYFNCAFDKIANIYYLQIRGNLKNYDDEINQFIDWISPYLDKEPGEFLGFFRYEEDAMPTIITMPEANHARSL